MPESTTSSRRNKCGRSQPKRFYHYSSAACRSILVVSAFAMLASSRRVTSFSPSSQPPTSFVRSAVSLSANFRGGGEGGRPSGTGSTAGVRDDGRGGGTRRRGGSLSASSSQRAAEETSKFSPPRQQRQIPITVLSGFLGSGKTSLLQHLLTNNRGLKIAVIVNDVASLNVDSKLVRENVAAPSFSPGGEGSRRVSPLSGKAAGIVQLENGCACCSLSGELLNSVAELVTLSDMRRQADDGDEDAEFDHIVVELSGVAEPGAIRANFQEAAMYGMPILERVRLDTMITVIDCSTFLQNLRSAKGATPKDAPELYYRTDEERVEAEKLAEGGWAEGLPSKLLEALNAPSSLGASSGASLSGAVGDLLVEQTEVADIVLLNKVDLLGEAGANADDVLREIREIVTALNPRARTMVTEYGQVGDILDVLGSIGEDGGGVAEAGVVDDHRDFVAAALGHASHTHDEQGEAACVDLDCTDPSHTHSHSETVHTPAESSEASGCADSDPSQSHDHSHSHSHSESCADPGCTDPSHDHSSTANTSGIGTFVYSARRPFHPTRLLHALRMLPVSRGVPMDDAEEKKRPNDSRVIETFGRILRSKGFAWTADSNTAALYWSHAGSSFEMQCLGRWWATLPRDQWPQEATDTILADFDVPTHDEHGGADSTQTSVGDRRQEVVFIGPGMDTAQQQADVRKVMDGCLLQDDEWELYKTFRKQEEKLKSTFGELPIQARMVTY